MTAAVIDGTAIAAELRARVSVAVRRLAGEYGLVPRLAVVLVGDNPASEVYIGAKTKMVAECGMRSIDHRLEASTSREALLALVAALNCDPEVHGILVQLPLPPQIDPAEVIAAIDPSTGFILSMSAALRTACRRSRRVRRSDASCWRRPCTRRSRVSKPW